MRQPLSLRGRALALLAQREQSPLELRRKLMRHARALALASTAALRGASAREAAGPPPDTGADPADLAADVDAVMAWLVAERYLSEERFAESRVNARAGRFGHQRIRHELAQHGVRLGADAAAALAATEGERAVAVQQRKYGAPPANAAEHARQARFLAARGFSSDAIRAALRRAPDARDTDHAEADGPEPDPLG